MRYESRPLEDFTRLEGGDSIEYKVPGTGVITTDKMCRLEEVQSELYAVIYKDMGFRFIPFKNINKVYIY